MKLQPFNTLASECRDCGVNESWGEALEGLATERLEGCRHGDFPKWCAALDSLPKVDSAIDPEFDLDGGTPKFGPDSEPSAVVRAALLALHPWRKGPLAVAGFTIDTEWRSDWKWDRIRDHVELAGESVLDIGCGNGYFGWRMLAAGAKLVVGIDPTWVYLMQWLACRHFLSVCANYVLPLGIEELPPGPAGFDNVFSMGVLYHRRRPLRHLGRLWGLMKPGGRLVLETLVLPEERMQDILRPDGRYARMRNVWAIPGTHRLLEWVERSRFERPSIVDVSQTTPVEQRSTPWMRFDSLAEALDPDNPGLTIEGHPAPRRAVLIAYRG